MEFKEFVTATADSINGGGIFADFLRLLVCEVIILDYSQFLYLRPTTLISSWI